MLGVSLVLICTHIWTEVRLDASITWFHVDSQAEAEARARAEAEARAKAEAEAKAKVFPSCA